MMAENSVEKRLSVNIDEVKEEEKVKEDDFVMLEAVDEKVTEKKQDSKDVKPQMPRSSSYFVEDLQSPEDIRLRESKKISERMVRSKTISFETEHKTDSDEMTEETASCMNKFKKKKHKNSEKKKGNEKTGEAQATKEKQSKIKKFFSRSKSKQNSVSSLNEVEELENDPVLESMKNKPRAVKKHTSSIRKPSTNLKKQFEKQSTVDEDLFSPGDIPLEKEVTEDAPDAAVPVFQQFVPPSNFLSELKEKQTHSATKVDVPIESKEEGEKCVQSPLEELQNDLDSPAPPQKDKNINMMKKRPRRPQKNTRPRNMNIELKVEENDLFQPSTDTVKHEETPEEQNALDKFHDKKSPQSEMTAITPENKPSLLATVRTDGHAGKVPLPGFGAIPMIQLKKHQQNEEKEKEADSTEDGADPSELTFKEKMAMLKKATAK